MTKISSAFENGTALIAFLTAGDPSLVKTIDYILTMAESGADLIAIGIPFSDPVIEDEAVRRGALRSLRQGTTTDTIFAMVRALRRQTQIPLVFQTYINPIFTYGTEKFLAQCADAGICALMIPDLPFEEKDEICPHAQEYGIEIISMIAASSAGRVAMIAKAAQGFVYLTAGSAPVAALIRAQTQLPIVIGCDFTRPERADGGFADGIIAGNEIVRIIEEFGGGAAAHLAKYVAAMKRAVQSGTAQ